MIQEILENWCCENQMAITQTQLEQFENYAQILKEWNQKINLTAITEDSEIAVKHFIDSIFVLKYLKISQQSKIIDIGTGAGFPGIPLKIMLPDIQLTLLDSLNKRLIFLEEVCKTLSFQTELLHARAEEASQNLQYREKYDFAFSRAVANLPALCEYCIPYVKVNGLFISMKGPEGEKEAENSQNSISLLGGKLEKTCQFTLPDNSERTLLFIRKIKSTPPKYPRRGTKINKNPL